MSVVTGEDIRNRFTYHKPTEDQAERHSQLSEVFITVAGFVMENTPESAEQSIAIRKLEEAKFYASAAIARREPHG